MSRRERRIIQRAQRRFAAAAILRAVLAIAFIAAALALSLSTGRHEIAWYLPLLVVGATWTDFLDRAVGFLWDASTWNTFFGATGSVMAMKGDFGWKNLVLNSDFGRRTIFGLAMPEVFADLLGTTKIDAGAAGSVAANIFTQGAANNEYAWCAGSFVWRDGRASATFKATSTTGIYELKFRVDANNWFAAKQNNGNFTITKSTAAADVVQATVAQALTLNRWYWIELEVQGSFCIAKIYDTGGTASGVTKASSTLLTTLGPTNTGALTGGASVSITSDQAAAQWGGIATGNGGVYVETWLPESFSVSFLGTLGGQAVGFDESVDSGPLNKQWAWRAYIPAASRRLYAEQISANGVIQPSVGYTFSGYMKESGQGGTGELAEWQIDGYDAAGVAGPGPTTQIANASAIAWTRRTTTWTPASTARRASIVTWVNRALTATGTAYFLAAQLEQGSAATVWRNAPADDAAPIVWNIEINSATTVTTTSLTAVEANSWLAQVLSLNAFLPWDAKLRVEVSASVSNSVNTNQSYIGAQVDGAAVSVKTDLAIIPYSGLVGGGGHGVAVGSFAAGKHRVAFLWHVDATTGTINVSPAPRLVVTATRGK